MEVRPLASAAIKTLNTLATEDALTTAAMIRLIGASPVRTFPATAVFAALPRASARTSARPSAPRALVCTGSGLSSRVAITAAGVADQFSSPAISM